MDVCIHVYTCVYKSGFCTDCSTEMSGSTRAPNFRIHRSVFRLLHNQTAVDSADLFLYMNWQLAPPHCFCERLNFCRVLGLFGVRFPLPHFSHVLPEDALPLARLLLLPSLREFLV